MKPHIIIAPYFYMKPNTFSEWIDVNLKLIDDCKELGNEIPLWAQVVIDPGLLFRSDNREKLIEKYINANCEGICLWVDDLDEHEADEDTLLGMVKFIKSIIKSNKQIFIAYGGYFSAILTKLYGVTGICHGLEYGESRPVAPVGGGIPMAKYYFPPLHKRLRYNEALQILEAKGWLQDSKYFYDEVCNCQVCQEIIDGNMDNFSKFGESKPVTFQRKGQTVTLNYPLPETKDRSLRHYLMCKKREFVDLQTTTEEGIRKSLEKIRNDYSRILGLEGVSFAKVWKNVIEQST